MKGNGKPSLTVGGKFADTKVAASYDAETFAAVNALYVARARSYFVTGQAVMLQSDCLHTLNVIRHHVPGVMEAPHAEGLATNPIRASKLKKADREAIDAITKLLAETPITIIVRHVRGHRPGRGRAWVNKQCDRIAKRHMRAARSEAKAVP